MSDKKLPDPDKMTFEQAVGELESIINQIDGGEADLEAMMKSHARGQLLVKRCKSLLSTAEQQLQTVEVDELSE